jgi:hypothetical protein
LTKPGIGVSHREGKTGTKGGIVMLTLARRLAFFAAAYAIVAVANVPIWHLFARITG